MKPFDSFSIRNKILISFAVVITLVMITVAIGYIQLNQVKTSTMEVIPAIVQVDYLRRMTLAIESLESNLDHVTILGGEIYKENAVQDLEKMFTMLESVNGGAGEIDLPQLGELEIVINDLQTETNILLKMGPTASSSREINAQVILTYSHIANARQMVNELTKETLSQLHKNVTDQENTISFVINQFLILAVAVLALGIAISLKLSKHVSEPIVKLKNLTKDITKGNFDIEIKTSSKDEVGELATAFNTMVRQLDTELTERVQVEQALRESEENYRNLVETSQDLIWKHDLKGRFTYLNPAWEGLLGYRADEMLGRVFAEFKPPEIGPRDSKTFQTILDGEDIFGYETVFLTKSGEERNLVLNAKRLRDAAGTIVGTQGTAHDITERVRAEQALQKSERLLQESHKIARIGYYDLDIASGVWESSEALNELFGIDWDYQTDITGWLQTVHPEDRDMMTAYFANEVLGKGRNFDKEYRILRVSDGEMFWVHGLGKLDFDDNGTPIRMIGNIQDITTRRRAEAALRTKTSELEALFSISSHLRTAQSADAMLPLVLEEIGRVLETDSNAVILLDSDSEHFTYALGDGSLAPNTGKKFPVEKSISGLIQKKGQPYRTEDLSADKNSTKSVLGTENLGPAILAAIQSETEFLGVLLCARNKDNRLSSFSPSDVKLLTAIGEMVGNALQRARLYDQALTRLQNVQALHSIDMAISANMDLPVILDVLITQGAAQLDVDAMSVLLLNPLIHTLEYAAGHGFHTKEIESTRLKIGEGLPGQVALNRKTLQVPNLLQNETFTRKQLLDEGFVSYQAAPLVAKGELHGVLEMFSRTPLVVTDEKTGFLETLATQAAIAIENTQLFNKLQRSNFELEMAYDATIEGWSRALDLRDQETEGHTLRVADITLNLALALGLTGDELVNIRRGALLHDIGKMGVPDNILLKPGKLDADEWEVMKMHPVYAFDMLWPIEFLRPSLDIPQYHHERWDGSGYPRQLSGEQIPLSARLFAIADVWDALTSDRPYRKAWTEKKALKYITANDGKHFDPQVVELFLALRNKNGQI